MRNNGNSFWFVTALLIASLTACSSSGGTTSSPSSVTPQISKLVTGPPTVNVYDNAPDTVAAVYTSNYICWTPFVGYAPYGKSLTETPTGDASCTSGTIYANTGSPLGLLCQLVWDGGTTIVVVNHSETNCTWSATSPTSGTFTYQLLGSALDKRRR
jgi:hypothetical protein